MSSLFYLYRFHDPFSLESPSQIFYLKHFTPGKSHSTPSFPEVSKSLHWGLMERRVIHHTSFVVLSSQLPALKDTVFNRAPCPLREQELPSCHVLTAYHIFFPVGALIPLSNLLLSPLRSWASIPGSSIKAKQGKIDVLQKSWPCPVGFLVQYMEQPILPHLGFSHWIPTQELRSREARIQPLFIPNTNDAPHSPNLPGFLTLPSQNVSEMPQAFLD